MKSAITVSLVPQARGGPFVYWDDLEAAFQSASRLGFDGIEIFPATPEGAATEIVRPLMEKYGLAVAALGTGGGWVAHKWHFGSPDPAIRGKAREFVRSMIEAAAALGAKAIVGSMQGKPEPGVSREQGIAWLAEALEELGAVAEGAGQPLLYEPLNRYESHLFNRLGQTVEFLGTLRTTNVKILADMFHMNIEEVSVPLAIRAAGRAIGHFHFADSNRHAIGFGHTDVAPITESLKEAGYDGYVSGEVLPLPDSESAAAQTIRAYRRYVLGQEEA
jgi:sugar phosphate isomerase/epimerase